jgi:hypothetical protein
VSLTIEQNEEFNRLRNELINLTTAFHQLARDVGAEPMAEGDPIVPVGPIPPFQSIPDDIAAGIGTTTAWKKTQAAL